jgi:hypothetical protein
MTVGNEPEIYVAAALRKFYKEKTESPVKLGSIHTSGLSWL